MSAKNLNRENKIWYVLPFFLVLLFLNTTLSVKAQQHATVSPYSRYGIGTLTPNSFIPQTGRGNTGIASYAPERINFANAASYSYDTITTIEAGIKGEISELSTQTNSQTANQSSLSYIAFGFPVVKNKWGASFGVLPYSATGYKITAQQTNDQLGMVDYKFEGDGALTRFYIGNAYAPFGKSSVKFSASDQYKKLVADHDTLKINRIIKRNNILKGFSIGVNASWLFGSIKQSRSVEFADAPNTYNTKIFYNNSMGDAYFEFGLLYSYIKKNQIFFNAGLTGAMTTDISTRTNSVWYNYTAPSGVFENIADTIQTLIDFPGITTIPAYYSGGIAVGRKDNWIIEANYTMQDWTKFKSNIENTPLNTSYNIALGGEYIPDKKGFKYLQKIQYRLGGHYSKTYVTLNNTDIKNYGVAFGFGLPIINKDRVQKATFQLAFEAGREGTKNNNLLMQQYVRFHLGITVNELWFVKRKYD